MLRTDIEDAERENRVCNMCDATSNSNQNQHGGLINIFLSSHYNIYVHIHTCKTYVGTYTYYCTCIALYIHFLHARHAKQSVQIKVPRLLLLIVKINSIDRSMTWPSA